MTGAFAFEVFMEILLSPEDQDLLKYPRFLSSGGHWMINKKELCTTNNPWPKEYVHRIVLQRVFKVLPAKNIAVIDHINNIKIDNRRENLRLISASQNVLRSIKKCKNELGFWRVSYSSGRYKVLFRVNGRTNYFGLYDTLEDAAFWADVYSYRLQSEESPLNFPDKLEEIREAALELDIPAYPWKRDPHANISRISVL